MRILLGPIALSFALLLASCGAGQSVLTVELDPGGGLSTSIEIVNLTVEVGGRMAGPFTIEGPLPTSAALVFSKDLSGLATLTAQGTNNGVTVATTSGSTLIAPSQSSSLTLTFGTPVDLGVPPGNDGSAPPKNDLGSGGCPLLTTWNEGQAGGDFLFSVAMTNGNYLVAGQNDGVYYSTDRMTWTHGGGIVMNLQGVATDFNVIWAGTCGTAWTVDDTGRIFSSTDNGQSWLSETVQGTPTLTSIWTPDCTHVFATADLGEVFTRGAGNPRWPAPAILAQKTLLQSIWGSSLHDMWIADDKGNVFHSTDGAGAAWSVTGATGAPSLSDLWGTSSNNVYAVGKGGVVVHTTDGGNSWQLENTGIQSDLNAISGSGPNDLYIVGGDNMNVDDPGIVLHSTGDGNWTPVAMTPSADLFGILVEPSCRVTMVGAGGLVAAGP